MDVQLTDEQLQLQQMARAVLSSPEQATWARLAELGLLGVGMSESRGGSGGGVVEQAVLCEEAGWTLTGLPILPVLVARAVLEHAPSTWAAELVDEIIDGSLKAVVAVAADDGQWQPARTGVRWTGSAAWGRKRFVEGAAGVHQLVVTATMDDGSMALVAVPTNQDAVAVRPLPAIADGVWSDVALAGANGMSLGAGWVAVENGLTLAAVLQAAWCTGAGRHLVADTVAYVSQRRAFGVPIGSFQTVQHRLVDADMAMVESQTLARRAAWMLDAGDGAARRMASTAFLHATEALVILARSCHQVWGGMGYSTDVRVHLYSRQAKMARQAWGGRDYHAGVVADELGRSPLLLRRYEDMAHTAMLG